jgi:hypothetical protein
MQGFWEAPVSSGGRRGVQEPYSTQIGRRGGRCRAPPSASWCPRCCRLCPPAPPPAVLAAFPAVQVVLVVNIASK